MANDRRPTTSGRVSPRQLRRLMTLWRVYAQRSLDELGDQRLARLAWATANCGRPITSFCALTRSEANSLIDVLQTAIGQPTEPARRQRSKLDREAARAAGTEGRRGGERGRISLVRAEDLERITGALTRLGWDQERFQAWLRSPSSPLGRRSSRQIRTVADANRVWWALKRILKQEGKWTAA